MRERGDWRLVIGGWWLMPAVGAQLRRLSRQPPITNHQSPLATHRFSGLPPADKGEGPQ